MENRLLVQLRFFDDGLAFHLRGDAGRSHSELVKRKNARRVGDAGGRCESVSTNGSVERA
jgi:hypothetical protein